MFKKQIRITLIAFMLGMAPFIPNIECLPIFEKDKIVHLKTTDNEKNKDEDKSMIGKKLDQNTQLTTASGCTFTVEKGWFVSSNQDAIILEEPDRELTGWILENNEKTAQDAVLAAWKKVQTDFARIIKHTVQGIAADGWDEIVQFVYDTTTQENLIILAIAQRCGTTWHIKLINGTQGALERRMAGIGLITSSFKVPGIQEESFAGKKAHVLDAARLQELSKFAEEARKQCEVPGVAIGIVQNGQIIFAQGFGVRELGKTEPVTPNTLFMIGSTTKSLTTFMMARLIDEGVFTWNTPVTELMPNFALGNEETTKQVLMKHMVSASTGISRQDMEFFFNFDRATPEFRLAEMRNMKPTTGFGETFQYSNAMVSAGGYIAAHNVNKEVGLGAAYDSVMQSCVFDPINMTKTTFDFNKVRQCDHAIPHSIDLNHACIPMSLNDEQCTESLRPAGGAWSNVLDLAHYMIVELNNGINAYGKRIISQKNLLKRREPQTKIADKMSYGLGLMMEDDHGVLSVGHGGATMGFITAMFFLPEHNTGLVILTNYRNASLFAGAVSRKFMELLFDGKLLAQETVKNNLEQQSKAFAKNLETIVFEPETAWSKQFVGTYVHPTLGQIVVREIAGGVELDAGTFKSKIGQRKETDGTLKLILTQPPFTGLEFLPQEINGSMHLTLEMGQHKYVFERPN